MKLVINTCFGGFGLSEKAMRFIAKRRGHDVWVVKQSTMCTVYYKVPPEQRPKPINWQTATLEDKATYTKMSNAASFYCRDFDRSDPDLVAAVETLGDEANDWAAKLKVVEVPDGVSWTLEDYDGMESVHEVHRSWD